MRLNKMIKKYAQKKACDHNNVREVTTFGDNERKFKCADCGAIIKKEF